MSVPVPFDRKWVFGPYSVPNLPKVQTVVDEAEQVAIFLRHDASNEHTRLAVLKQIHNNNTNRYKQQFYHHIRNKLTAIPAVDGSVKVKKGGVLRLTVVLDPEYNTRAQKLDVDWHHNGRILSGTENLVVRLAEVSKDDGVYTCVIKQDGKEAHRVDVDVEVQFQCLRCKKTTDERMCQFHVPPPPIFLPRFGVPKTLRGIDKLANLRAWPPGAQTRNLSELQEFNSHARTRLLELERHAHLEICPYNISIPAEVQPWENFDRQVFDSYRHREMLAQMLTVATQMLEALEQYGPTTVTQLAQRLNVHKPEDWQNAHTLALAVKLAIEQGHPLSCLRVYLPSLEKTVTGLEQEPDDVPTEIPVHINPRFDLDTVYDVLIDLEYEQLRKTFKRWTKTKFGYSSITERWNCCNRPLNDPGCRLAYSHTEEYPGSYSFHTLSMREGTLENTPPSVSNTLNSIQLYKAMSELTDSRERSNLLLAANLHLLRNDVWPLDGVHVYPEVVCGFYEESQLHFIFQRLVGTQREWKGKGQGSFAELLESSLDAVNLDMVESKYLDVMAEHDDEFAEVLPLLRAAAHLKKAKQNNEQQMIKDFLRIWIKIMKRYSLLTTEDQRKLQVLMAAPLTNKTNKVLEKILKPHMTPNFIEKMSKDPEMMVMILTVGRREIQIQWSENVRRLAHAKQNVAKAGGPKKAGVDLIAKQTVQEAAVAESTEELKQIDHAIAEAREGRIVPEMEIFLKKKGVDIFGGPMHSAVDSDSDDDDEAFDSGAPKIKTASLEKHKKMHAYLKESKKHAHTPLVSDAELAEYAAAAESKKKTPKTDTTTVADAAEAEEEAADVADEGDDGEGDEGDEGEGDDDETSDTEQEEEKAADEAADAAKGATVVDDEDYEPDPLSASPPPSSPTAYSPKSAWSLGSLGSKFSSLLSSKKSSQAKPKEQKPKDEKEKEVELAHSSPGTPSKEEKVVPVEKLELPLSNYKQLKHITLPVGTFPRGMLYAKYIQPDRYWGNDGGDWVYVPPENSKEAAAMEHIENAYSVFAFTTIFEMLQKVSIMSLTEADKPYNTKSKINFFLETVVQGDNIVALLPAYKVGDSAITLVRLFVHFVWPDKMPEMAQNTLIGKMWKLVNKSSAPNRAFYDTYQSLVLQHAAAESKKETNDAAFLTTTKLKDEANKQLKYKWLPWLLSRAADFLLEDVHEDITHMISTQAIVRWVNAQIEAIPKQWRPDDYAFGMINKDGSRPAPVQNAAAKLTTEDALVFANPETSNNRLENIVRFELVIRLFRQFYDLDKTIRLPDDDEKLSRHKQLLLDLARGRIDIKLDEEKELQTTDPTATCFITVKRMSKALHMVSNRTLDEEAVKTKTGFVEFLTKHFAEVQERDKQFAEFLLREFPRGPKAPKLSPVLIAQLPESLHFRGAQERVK